MIVRTVCLFLFLSLRAPTLCAQVPSPPTAETIMARVAASQDQAEAERSRFVYVQHADVQSRAGKIVQCHEVTEFRVVPAASGQKQVLLSLDGHLRNQDTSVHYSRLPDEKKDGDTVVILDVDNGNNPVTVKDTDIDLVEHMRESFTADSKSKDGVSAGLFPLTTKAQKDLVFELRGHQQQNGRDTFHIVFHPRNKEDFGWKGDAWIDSTSYQPVVIRTALSRSIPLGVRMLLGTNVPGLGFTVTYAPQLGDVWFPESFGTEFKIKVLFFFNRTIVVSVRNHSFERTHVTSTLRPVEPTP